MTTIPFSLSSTHIIPPLSSLNKHPLNPLTSFQFPITPLKLNPLSSKLCLCNSETSITTYTTTTSSSSSSESESEENDENGESKSFLSTSNGGGLAPPVLKKRKRYRKEYPGETRGITEEMRFVAMKLRNSKGSSKFGADFRVSDEEKSNGNDGWEPSMEGFLKYLVDSKLVFETIERVVEDSNDVSYAYFRRTGLERSGSLARDLEWFSQQGMAIPEPSNPGVSYASYLQELAEKSAPLFLSHFYNVYFSHIAGGQVIAKQVAEKLLKERQLEFFNWEGDEHEFLKEVREKLNRLGEHWSRDDKNKCLKESTKSFRYLGQIVRLIIIL
ncbi:hypothetical protein BVRB_1g013110 [Beta vulgaris subsp. vulgaris]|uniref:probable inactive heme oxygenase 2, chloroplastic isoform X2 n=1 Tax=Beta vulgaris subsp. vulgaris TaxID=3555 RepID=UPI00053F7010|nr:probable inactive heme oxygenase 2, chloroplastic isoform X2 [Beta vulgaris subsp. vulgaris]XP_048501052.1 probable inactive heme oxygenase 2, chloroplastic isoform X2 [Beta vulgaris subsp. vulgaris]KMT19305.1 hypothetical protein BVRB_1g013110 [Beta vulgaris subsp. vulgaris]